MLNKIFVLCLFLTLVSGGLSLSCSWMDHKFREYSRSSLDLLDIMGEGYTEDTTGVSFPYNLYSKASTASAEDQLWFMVQTLEEMISLFEEDHDSVSWRERTVEDFLNVVDQQRQGLRSCIVNQRKKNKRLHMYFKRLSHHVLQEMGHSAEAWELIRTEIRFHLNRIDQLAASAFNTI